MSSTGGRSWRPRDTLLRAKDRSPPALVRFVLHLVREWQKLEPFDRAMTLAAQAFTSIFPLVIAAASVLRRDDSRQFGDKLSDLLGLPASTQKVLSDAVSPDAATITTFGILGLLIVLLSATSFSRALTRMYGKAWSVRPPPWSEWWRWIAAIVAIASCAVSLKVVQRVAVDNDAEIVGLLLTGLVSSVLWTWVPWLLLARRVPWVLLTPGGVIMGMASVLLAIAGRIYMPRALEHAASRFGDLGVAFTYIGWLFSIAFVLIAATVVGKVLATEFGPLSRLLARHAGGTYAPEPPESLIHQE